MESRIGSSLNLKLFIVFLIVLTLTTIFSFNYSSYKYQNSNKIRLVDELDDRTTYMPDDDDETAEEQNRTNQYLEHFVDYLKKWKSRLTGNESQTRKSVLETYASLLNETHALLIEEQQLSPFKVTERPIPINSTLNCVNPLYKSFLTSKQVKEPARIFDVVIFAYELVILEIRLFELYDAVDEFLVFEANITFKRIYKPFFFLENVRRFERFLDKITYFTPFNIYRFNKDGTINMTTDVKEEDVLEEYKTTSKLPESVLKNDARAFFTISYSIEARSRTLTIDLYSKYIRQIGLDEIIIHGDVDEIPSGDIVNHFKHCEVQEKYPYSFWSTFYMFKFRFLFKSDFPADELGDPYSFKYPNIYRLKDLNKENKSRPSDGTILPRASGAHCNRFFTTFAIGVFKSMSLSDNFGLDDLSINIIKNSSKSVYYEIRRRYSNGTFRKHFIKRLITLDLLAPDRQIFIPWIVQANKHVYRDFLK